MSDAVIHDFGESLKKSHEQEDAEWWEPTYRKAFCGFASMTSVRVAGWAQRGGIDRVITLKSGRTITVDEKVRDSDWPDILFERWSDTERRTPGWIQKDLACDYIAYAFIPSKTCYLLPFLQMRKAWVVNGKTWIEKAFAKADGFRVVNARNKTYTTQSIAVPIPEALRSIQESMIVGW